MITKQDYPICEEVLISVLADNHNPSNIKFFVTDEKLNIWILFGSSFYLNGLFSVRFFKVVCDMHIKMKISNFDMLY